MDSIMAPERMQYIKSEKPEGCIFCRESLREKELVLYEGTSCYVMLNKYPYTSGHLLVAPFRHVPHMEQMNGQEMAEMMELTVLCVRVLKEAYTPEGFNIGMNLGRVAGAGVDDHLHVHIVPRWLGDINFSTVVGEVRVIPEDLATTRNTLLRYFGKREER
jgi:ATP adenylyltransferase